jgi:ATP-dependent DNA helicase DinG
MDMALSSPPTYSERGLASLDTNRVRDILGPDSLLAAALPEFELREPQRDMAGAVAHVFKEGGELLVEAGTGTGKTLAYLIPAVLSGQRVVVSTGTKNLQEQLFYKDIPLVRKALSIPFSACLMKGRGNYLCLSRHAQFSMQPSFRFFDEATHFDTLNRWAAITETGDRSEITGAPERMDFWQTISARSDNCVGKDCPDFDRCYVTRLRQTAAESEIIVVNHHLLFADLIVREGSFGEVIPDYDHLILDEAHQLEDVATHYFGLTVSSARIEELVRDAESAWDTRATGRHLEGARVELRRLRHAGQLLFEAFRSNEERYRLKPNIQTPEQEHAYQIFTKHLQTVRSELTAIPNPDESTLALARRAAAIETELETILTVADPESVSWCELRDRSRAFRASPIHVAPMLESMLFSQKRTVVMTSATLTVENSFDYVSSRLGVASEKCQVLSSPFDFRQQALLYVPRRMPAPREPAYLERAVEEIRALLTASRGRAFVLFTSFANLHAVRRAIEGELPYPFFVQGEAPRGELLERFRATEGAVLLGTSSFWEGVDVMGDGLSCVIVDKLPFAVPNDPLVSARIDRVETSGGSGFHGYQVPMAILTLKQGLGRLIRSRSDRGVVAILDSRIVKMSYGRRFLASLPPYPLTHDRDEVVRFFDVERDPGETS